ncbi:homoserine dehydrogenase [Magnetococcales bacterium HHB-1]
MKELRIGLLGCGTVGRGTATLLTQKKDLLKERTGVDITLVRIADRLFAEENHGIAFDGVELTTDAKKVVAADDIDVVIELFGGLDVAEHFVSQALDHDKHVVTANKALIAERGNRLLAKAKKQNRQLLFEASVAGTIPIIKAVRESLSANRILQIYGILNGTCNYILTEMRQRKLPFETVLKEAQEMGYAEADPSLDVDGGDAAHKLVILSSMAFGTPFVFDKAYIEGIRHISDLDIMWAQKMGYRIKLLAITRVTEQGLELRVHPTMVPVDSMTASVEGVFNAVFVKGDFADTTMYYGRGAGEKPTASAVVADVVDLARDLYASVKKTRVAPLSYHAKALREKPICAMDDLSGEYYLRLSVEDRPGALAEITAILRAHRISIKTVHQESASETQTDWVPLVLVTHPAREQAIQESIREIDALESVGETTRLIRIEDRLS